MRLTLETPRLTLRPFVSEDAEPMYSGWASDPEATKYLSWSAHETVEVTKSVIAQWLEEYEKPERLNFAIERKEDGRLIGGIDVIDYVVGVPVLGYVLAKEFWNRGYMTEACNCLLQYLFHRGYSAVRIDAMAQNLGSIRVIEKCGGVYEKTEEVLRPQKGDTVALHRYIVKRPS